MKAENLNIQDREISFRDREATLARLVAELETLKKLVHLEEMKLAGETATVRKKVGVAAAHPALIASTAQQARYIGTDPASGH